MCMKQETAMRGNLSKESEREWASTPAWMGGFTSVATRMEKGAAFNILLLNLCVHSLPQARSRQVCGRRRPSV